jgi:hypothetical protein
MSCFHRPFHRRLFGHAVQEGEYMGKLFFHIGDRGRQTGQCKQEIVADVLVFSEQSGRLLQVGIRRCKFLPEPCLPGRSDRRVVAVSSLKRYGRHMVPKKGWIVLTR